MKPIPSEGAPRTEYVSRHFISNAFGNGDFKQYIVYVLLLARRGQCYLQQELVAIVVFGLPSFLTDGATGIGQERDQAAHSVNSELQNVGRAWSWEPTCWQPLQRQLNLHLHAGVDGEENKVRPVLRRLASQDQLVHPDCVGEVVEAAVKGEADDFFPVVNLPDGPENGVVSQGEEVLVPGHVREDPALDPLGVMVLPRQVEETLVQPGDLLPALFTDEDDHSERRLVLISHASHRQRGTALGGHEEPQAGVNPSHQAVNSFLQGWCTARVGDDVHGDQEGIGHIFQTQLTCMCREDKRGEDIWINVNIDS